MRGSVITAALVITCIHCGGHRTSPKVDETGWLKPDGLVHTSQYALSSQVSDVNIVGLPGTLEKTSGNLEVSNDTLAVTATSIEMSGNTFIATVPARIDDVIRVRYGSGEDYEEATITLADETTEQPDLSMVTFATSGGEVTIDAASLGNATKVVINRDTGDIRVSDEQQITVPGAATDSLCFYLQTTPPSRMACRFPTARHTLILGGAGGHFATSFDLGRTWAHVRVGLAAHTPIAMDASPSGFLAVLDQAASGTTSAWYTPDGVDWTPATQAQPGAIDVAFGGVDDRWVVLHNELMVTTTTEPLDMWTSTSIAGIGYLTTLEAHDSVFVAGGIDGLRVTSTNGELWENDSGIPTPSETINTVGFGGGRFVALGALGIGYESPDDGVSWSRLADIPGNSDVLDVAYGLGGFVAIDGTTTTHQLPDGSSNWVSTMNAPMGATAIVFGHDRFFIIAATELYESMDGSSWTFVSPTPFELDAATTITFRTNATP